MNLEDIMLSEMSDREWQIQLHSYVESKRQSKWTNKQNRNSLIETKSLNKQVVARGEEGGGTDEISEGDSEVQTSSYKKKIGQGDVMYTWIL